MSYYLAVWKGSGPASNEGSLATLTKFDSAVVRVRVAKVLHPPVGRYLLLVHARANDPTPYRESDTRTNGRLTEREVLMARLQVMGIARLTVGPRWRLWNRTMGLDIA